MKIAVFTKNQARHVALVERLAAVADDVAVICEVTTHFPGQVDDTFPKDPDVAAYFAKVQAAERAVFGEPRAFPRASRVMPMLLGDLGRLPLDCLEDALSADVVVVFGSSYIKSPLIDILIDKGALNIHMGTSPYYRGSSCNFWALYDGRPDLVGATIHLLSRGLDSGEMLFHALPGETDDPFALGMKAVEAAHKGLAKRIADGSLTSLPPHAQDKARELRYTRMSDFGPDVVRQYSARPVDRDGLRQAVRSRDLGLFVNPFVAD